HRRRVPSTLQGLRGSSRRYRMHVSLPLLSLALLLGCPSDEIEDTDAGAYGEPTRLGACDLYDARRLRGVADLEPHDGEVEEISALGITLARPHRFGGSVFAMNLVRGEDGDDWSMPDHVVRRAGAGGLRLLVTL